jgi:sterol 3beta-glucosyltransferase
MSNVGADDMLFVGDVPHAWLFPQMSAVVHHGGAGTTAAALHAGVPQFIVPFLSDQPFWGHRVACSGVGPRPVPISRFTAAHLAAAVQRTDDLGMRRRAQELGRVARAEPGADGAVDAIHRSLERRAA